MKTALDIADAVVVLLNGSILRQVPLEPYSGGVYKCDFRSGLFALLRVALFLADQPSAKWLQRLLARLVGLFVMFG